MKLVLDTEVVVASVLSERGASRQLLLRVVDGLLKGAVSVPLMLECESVLKRSKILKASNLTENDMDVVLDQLAASMEHVEMFFLWRPMLRDAGDDMVLETAVNGQADTLVTFNVADFGDAPRRFGIELIRPGDMLRRL